MPQRDFLAAVGERVVIFDGGMGATLEQFDLGPADSATIVSLSFGLNVRDPLRLAQLIASGHTVTPEAYAAEFGPDPAHLPPALTEFGQQLDAEAEDRASHSAP